MAEHHLPDEVLTEILSRLPAKSLCKFKCVSKFLLNLSLNANFVKLHLTRALERDNREIIVKTIKRSNHDRKDGKEINIKLGGIPEFGMYAIYRTFIYCIDTQVGSLGNSHEIDVSFGSYWSTSTLLGSYNGIVCLGNEHRICLLNPCTREYKIFKVEIGNIRGDGVFGFVYDSCARVYKLVRVVKTKSENNESEISVYSLRDDDNDHISCSKVSNVPYQIHDRNSLAVFLNGAFHWMGHYNRGNTERIISFDVGSKLVLEIPRPGRNEFERIATCLTLGIVEGNLAVFSRDNIEAVIWVMQVYGVPDSWCKLFSISEDIWRVRIPHRTRPLHFTKNAQVLVDNGKTVVIDDLKRRTSMNLEIDAVVDGNYSDRIVIHVPSLVSLKSGKYVGAASTDEDHKNFIF